MYPPGLQFLLGDASSEAVSPLRKRPVVVRFSEWAAHNCLNDKIVLEALEHLQPVSPLPKTHVHSDSITHLDAKLCWQHCSEALMAAMPDLSKEIALVVNDAPKCLSARDTKHPCPFTYDIAADRLPFVSVQYRQRASDALAVAHEFGHALQIVASGLKGPDQQMQPVARECCAFLAELIVIHSLGGELPSLSEIHSAEDSIYLDTNRAALTKAAQSRSDQYQYYWNYPLARFLAAILFECDNTKIWSQLFSSGTDGGSLFNIILQHSIAEPAE